MTRHPVHGVLLLDKPKGLSSNDALQKAKWLLRAEKAGHTGTLDPLATGLLPLCFGAATKFSQLHLDADKRYEATVALGVKTTTGDAEGDVLETREVHVTTEQLQDVLQRFRGPIGQIPPMHSALKKDGKALYEYARAGIEVERAARNVMIYELEGVLELTTNSDVAGEKYTQSAIKLIVKCSKGTYIRTLGEDIGEALGCGAHLSSLRRVGTGGFDISQCVSLEALEAMTEAQRMACLLPVESLLEGHTRVKLDKENAGRFLNGVRRRADWSAYWQEGGQESGPLAVFGLEPHALLGTAHVIADELIPGRLLSPIEIEQIFAVV
ncbi:MAG: tRNA pseudouridine(55) synthase TruB [Burkholderiaceae bacterium]|nr:tRNA pseudouridine(55) synthase TruB [Burkholderiaceae bacterium]